MEITEEEFAGAVNSRSKFPIYEKMKKAVIGVAGLGGLGSNIVCALARSGAGTIVAVDFDTVELSNINRQMYTLKHLGMKKTVAIKKIISEINPFCNLITHDVFIDGKNCAEIFGGCQIVCEAFDNAQSKAVLVNGLLLSNKEVKVISGSGMAGFGRANDITTKTVSDRFFICGDMKTDVADGEGLTASRVMICAGHQASKAVEIILSDYDKHKDNDY